MDPTLDCPDGLTGDRDRDLLPRSVVTISGTTTILTGMSAEMIVEEQTGEIIHATDLIPLDPETDVVRRIHIPLLLGRRVPVATGPHNEQSLPMTMLKPFRSILPSWA